MWKQFLKDYFSFSNKSRQGIIFVIALILLCIFLPLAYPYFTRQKIYSYKEFEKEIAQLKIKATDSSSFRSYAKNYDNEMADDYSPADKKFDKVKAEVFYFDPNTASSADWQRLGVRDKTIKTIQNYLAKGGKFYKPEDIGKIWGLSPEDAKRLTPYVSIKKGEENHFAFEKKGYPKTTYPAKTIQPVDVNLADTSAFIALPGIGSKLSQRIIAFRDKLGGFYSISQVAETYLLPDSTFEKIKSRLALDNANVRKININTASIDEMKIHPYLRYTLANAIFQYRLQHGNFTSVEEIKKIMLISEDIFTKVAPYLIVR